eukprot:snap_masked-scaffold_69-processed-gene-0.35-mRNA-1 protein AED:1.00 eAED:1.00 QI:0/-1/0/0/-1/1/1/0/246
MLDSNQEEQSFDFQEPEEEVSSQNIFVLTTKIYETKINHPEIRNFSWSYRFKTDCIQAIIDGGATHHITGKRELLSDTTEVMNICVEGILKLTNLNTVSGVMKILLENNVEFWLKDVIYISNQKDTIISKAKLLESRVDVIKTSKECCLKFQGRKIKNIKPRNRNFILHATSTYKPKQPNQKINMKITKVKKENKLNLDHFSSCHLNNYILKSNNLETPPYEFFLGCAMAKTVGKNKKNHVNYKTS